MTNYQIRIWISKKKKKNNQLRTTTPKQINEKMMKNLECNWYNNDRKKIGKKSKKRKLYVTWLLNIHFIHCLYLILVRIGKGSKCHSAKILAT